MAYKVSKKFANATVSFRRGVSMVRIPRLEDATQDQLKELASRKHPGVIKEAPKKGSSSK